MLPHSPPLICFLTLHVNRGLDCKLLFFAGIFFFIMFLFVVWVCLILWCRADRLNCSASSPANCTVAEIALSGPYSAGRLAKVTNGLDIHKSTDHNSCPKGWKIWAPQSQQDWQIVVDATTIPAAPHRIVDVTRPYDGCYCSERSNYAMNSGVPERSGWVTTDGRQWWLRDSPWNQPSGNYEANCYLALQTTTPTDVQFDDWDCNWHSTDYLCQPISCTDTALMNSVRVRSVASGRTYAAVPNWGATGLQYTDRTHTFDHYLGRFAPQYGFIHICIANDDQDTPEGTVQFQLDVPFASTVYLVYGSGQVETPSWLDSENWTADGSQAQKSFPASNISVRGHNGLSLPHVFVLPVAGWCAVDCGPPSQAGYTFDCTGSAQRYGGTCQPHCIEGYAGHPTAICLPNGAWHYGGSCSLDHADALATFQAVGCPATNIPPDVLGYWRELVLLSGPFAMLEDMLAICQGISTENQTLCCGHPSDCPISMQCQAQPAIFTHSSLQSTKIPVCSTVIKRTIVTTAPLLCVPAVGGRMEYAGTYCGDGKILWTSARAIDIRSGLTLANCTWEFSAEQRLYAGSCGIAPTVDGGSQLPTTCTPDDEEWTRIFHCDGDASVDRLDFQWSVIMNMAETATRIRICYNEQCVTSKPNTFPIERLRLGQSIGGPLAGSPLCDSDCVQAVWTGSNLQVLEFGAASDAQDNALFHAHSNNGLHLWKNDRDKCRWRLQEQPVGPIEVFIDRGCPPLSGSGHRCGPWYGHARCSDPAHPYCNEAKGWCGNTAGHRDAEASVTYDHASIPPKCFKGMYLIRLTRPVSAGTTNDAHHLHIHEMEAYDASGASLQLTLSNPATDENGAHPVSPAQNSIDGDYTTGYHSAYPAKVIDKWIEWVVYSRPATLKVWNVINNAGRIVGAILTVHWVEWGQQVLVKTYTFDSTQINYVIPMAQRGIWMLGGSDVDANGFYKFMADGVYERGPFVLFKEGSWVWRINKNGAHWYKYMHCGSMLDYTYLRAWCCTQEAAEQGGPVCPVYTPGHQCASEPGSSCPECTMGPTCSCYGQVRYGYGNTWTAWHDVSGSIQCTSDVFGDPFPGQGKICQCVHTGGVSYVERSSGFCTPDCDYIETVAECNAAASALGWSDTTAEQYNEKSDLHGCFLQSNGVLRLNMGSPNSVECSSHTCACLCYTATCWDGIRNQGESAVDCGGPCTACATCSDFIKNQGESGIDCGGPCAACVQRKVEDCSRTLTRTIITTAQGLCVPVTGGQVEYTGTHCGDGKILWTSARAIDIRSGLTPAKCTWTWAVHLDKDLYGGSCGIAPTFDRGHQLPMSCAGASDCSWTRYIGMFSFGFAGVPISFDLPNAKAKCLEMGSSVCKAVTCDDNGSCTLRANHLLSVSPGGETTYVPSTTCYDSAWIPLNNPPDKALDSYSDSIPALQTWGQSLKDAKAMCKSQSSCVAFCNNPDDFTVYYTRSDQGYRNIGASGAGWACYKSAAESRSCTSIKEQWPSAPDGEYEVYIGGSATPVHCDMAGGGWTRIVNVLGTTPVNDYAGIPGAVRTGPSAAAFHKLSDATINALADGHNVWRFRCGSKTRLVGRATGWTSLRNQGDWKMDRNMDGLFECDANRDGYVFSTYPGTPLRSGANCDAADHMNYGSHHHVTGCFSEGEGWGQPMQIWWHSDEGCPPLSGSGHRCGPWYGHARCSDPAHPYCNEAKGWCGNTAGHRDAEASVTYDHASIPPKCFPKVEDILGQQGASCSVACWEAGGQCVDTMLHNPRSSLETLLAQEGLTCTHEEPVWGAGYQPCFVSGSDVRVGKCLGTIQYPETMPCDASHGAVRRLCRCSGLTRGGRVSTGICTDTISLNKTVTGSSLWRDYTGYTGATDGTLTYGWHGDVEASSFLVLDLEGIYTVSAMTLITMHSSANYSFRTLAISISDDGVSFVDVRTDQSEYCAALRTTFHDGWQTPTRYIKITMGEVCGGNVFAIAEWTVKGCAETCATNITRTITTTATELCVPVTGGRVQYTGRHCGNGSILWTSAMAIDLRTGLEQANCTWNWLNHPSQGLYGGFCGIAPTFDGGDRLPTTCSAGYLYFKLDVSANNGAAYTCIDELQVFDTTGNAGVVQAATSSSQSDAAHTIDKAHDGKRYGQTGNGHPAENGGKPTHFCTNTMAFWLTFQMQAPFMGQEYEITADPNQGNNCTPRAWKLYGSTDGVGWSLLDTQGVQGLWGKSERRVYSILTRLRPAVCPTFTDEAACTSSKDSRAEWFDQPCHWCCGDLCTSDNANLCEPKEWLLVHATYVGHSKNGDGYDTCGQCSNQATADSAATSSGYATKTYYLGMKGTVCPQGHVISSKVECELAHMTLDRPMSPQWVGDYPAIPPGCSNTPGPDWALHWNGANDGAGRGDLAPVCKNPVLRSTSRTSHSATCSGYTYHVTAFGSVCDSGHVLTVDQCKHAADSIPGLTWRWGAVIADMYSPRGCFCLGPSSDCHLHFNLDITNPTSSDCASICQATDPYHNKQCIGTPQDLEYAQVYGGNLSRPLFNSSWGAMTIAECLHKCRQTPDCVAVEWGSHSRSGMAECASAWACSGMTARDGGMVIPSECERGYFHFAGSIPGPGRIQSLTVHSCAGCAMFCDFLASCQSYECDGFVCELNDLQMPTSAARHLFVFCTKQRTCNLTPLQIGASSSASKVFPWPVSPSLQCPKVCGRECRSNTDFLLAPHTFDVAIDFGRVAVTRTDRQDGWSMQLVIPCCSPERACEDSPLNWKDSKDNDCKKYEDLEWCTGRKGYGPGWTGGTFAHYRRNGLDATQACCACGGGTAGGCPSYSKVADGKVCAVAPFDSRPMSAVASCMDFCLENLECAYFAYNPDSKACSLTTTDCSVGSLLSAPYRTILNKIFRCPGGYMIRLTIPFSAFHIPEITVYDDAGVQLPLTVSNPAAPFFAVHTSANDWYVKKFSAKWPHCSNSKCLTSAVFEDFKLLCSSSSDCTGFSFPIASKGNIGGCLKKCGTTEGSDGYGFGPHDYFVKTEPDLCPIARVYIGPSDSRTRSVPLPEGVDWCPAFCGKGCRTNTDFPNALDTFRVTISDRQVSVERAGAGDWSMHLEIPCCAGMTFYGASSTPLAYADMAQDCDAKGARLPTFEDLCPKGVGSIPIGGQHSDGDTWVPIQAQRNGNQWVQIGNRDGGTCNPLSSLHLSTPGGCSWCTDQKSYSHKGVYGCIAGDTWGSKQKGICVAMDNTEVISDVSQRPAWADVNNDDCLAWCKTQAGATGCELNEGNGTCFVHHSSSVDHGNGVSDSVCWIANAAGSELRSDGQLHSGERRRSPNHRYWLIQQGDGNLVLYDSSDWRILWQNAQYGTAAARTVMQNNGNLVSYTADGTALWASLTEGNPGAYLVVHNHGNMIIYVNGTSIWASNTGQDLRTQDSKFHIQATEINSSTITSELYATWYIASSYPSPAFITIQDPTAICTRIGCVLDILERVDQGFEKLQTHTIEGHSLRGSYSIALAGLKATVLVPSGRSYHVGPAAASDPVYTDDGHWAFEDLGDFVTSVGFSYVTPANDDRVRPSGEVQLELITSMYCTVYLVYLNATNASHASARPWIADEGWEQETTLRRPVVRGPVEVRTTHAFFKPFFAGKIRLMGNAMGNGTDELMPMIFLKYHAGSISSLLRTQNLAEQSAGGIPFASSSHEGGCSSPNAATGVPDVKGPHCWRNINDGRFGHESSWRPGMPYHEDSFVGVVLPTLVPIRYVAFGRDATGRSYKDGWERENYTLQYTAKPLHPLFLSADLAWQDDVPWNNATTYTLTSARTHVFELQPPVRMTAVRMKVSSGGAIVDELQLYPEVDPDEDYNSVADGECKPDPRPYSSTKGFTLQFVVRLTNLTDKTQQHAPIRCPKRSAQRMEGDWVVRFSTSPVSSAETTFEEFKFLSDGSERALMDATQWAQLEVVIFGNEPEEQKFEYAFRVGVQYDVRIIYAQNTSNVVLFVANQTIQSLSYSTARNAVVSDGLIGCCEGNRRLQGTIQGLKISNTTRSEASCSGSEALLKVTRPNPKVGWTLISETSPFRMMSWPYEDAARETSKFCLYGGKYAFYAVGPTSSSSSLSLTRNGVQVFDHVTVTSTGETREFSLLDDKTRCGTSGVGITNLALHLPPTTSTTCAGSDRPAVLTDGDYPPHEQGGVWQSCPKAGPAAVEVAFSSSHCVREVRIWPNFDEVLADVAASPAGNTAIAEVQTLNGQWEQCGDIKSPLHGSSNFTFQCALYGSRVRIRSQHPPFALSEIEIFPEAEPDPCIVPNVNVAECQRVVVNVHTSSSADDVDWAIGGACPPVSRSGLGPNTFDSTPLCLAEGHYQFVVLGDLAADADGGTATVAVLDGSSSPATPRMAVKRGRVNAAFHVPKPSRSCDKRPQNPHDDGCLPVTLNISSESYVNFSIVGSCPPVNDTSLNLQPPYSTTVCLAPGQYTFVALDTEGDGWEHGTFAVALQGPFGPLISSTEVHGFGHRASFRVPESLPSTQTYHWLHSDGEDKYYVNLPPVDNWSEASPLKTTWQRLRLHRNPFLAAWRRLVLGGCPAAYPYLAQGGEADGTICYNYISYAEGTRIEALGSAKYEGAWCALPRFEDLLQTLEAENLRESTKWCNANQNEVCWDQCGEFGSCPEFCGTGKCCQKGNQPEPGDCLPEEGGDDAAICVPASTYVYADLTDTTYATSNGHRSHKQLRTYMKWGAAEDCRGSNATSEYRLNLLGTPFALEPMQPSVPHAATGPGATCDNRRRTCAGRCGGGSGNCGVCGFGQDQNIQLVRLVVVDVLLFKKAFVVNCGPPHRARFDFTGCDHTYGGVCQPKCQEPFTGSPGATCGSNGRWEYSGECKDVALCFTMGLNSYGQLGLRHTTNQNEPQAVHADEHIHTVAVGGWHSAFLTSKRAYVVGSNQVGQLGLGPGVKTVRGELVELPSPLHTGAAITAIAVGNSHTVFVAGGKAYAMGENRVGQLGLDRATLLEEVPRQVQAPTGARIAGVAAGSFHTAFITEAGEDFDERDFDAANPRWRCLFEDRLVRLDSKGDAQCLCTVLSDGTECFDPPGGCSSFTTNGTDLRTWTCGTQDYQVHHWCFETRMRLTGPQAYVFGWNSRGQLGRDNEDGPMADRYRNSPQLLEAPDAAIITDVALGREHSAFLAGGKLYTFGSNSHGQLGRDDTKELWEPSEVKAPATWTAATWTAVSLGHYHTAAIFGETLYVMGSNEEGQLGVGCCKPKIESQSKKPTKIESPNGRPVTAVAAGARTTAFIAGRDCYVMGSNLYGELGLGSVGIQWEPHRLETPNGFAIDTIALGWFHSAFLAVTTMTPTASPSLSATMTRSGTSTPSTSDTPTPTLSSTRTGTLTRSTTTSFTPSSSPTPTLSPASTPTPTPSLTPTFSPSSTPTATPSPTPTLSPTSTPTPTPSPTPTFPPSSTPTSTPSPTPTLSLSSKPTSTPSPTPTLSASSTPTSTPSPTPTLSRSSTPTAPPSPTPTLSPASTPTSTPSPTPTTSTSSTPTFTLSPTPSVSLTTSTSSTPTSTRSPTPTTSTSNTPTSTRSPTPTTSTSSTPTATPSPTPTTSPSSTPTFTLSPTPSVSLTTSTSSTPTSTPSATHTTSGSSTPTSTRSPTPTTSPSSTSTPTPSVIFTTSASSTPTCTSSTTTSSSLSRAPTSTFSPTSTTSPSSSSTPTASVIFTTSASSTPTCTPSTTTSSSLSRAPTSTFSPTPTTSPSSTSTPTPSVIFTTSASSTPTCTPSTTTSSSLSRAPTSTFSPTSTTSPSSTSTPTASVIFTTSASSTPTCTPSTTTSSSLSRAPTSTFSPTPTTSPSSTSTPTASVIFTTSASSTPTCTPSTTTSSSLSRAPTSTFSPTPTTSPSSSSTPTPSVIFTTSASSTPTCTPSTTTSSSLSRAPTSTFSPTPTTSPSSTSTPTPSVIFTTSASSTPTCTSSTTTSSSLSRAPTSTFSPTSTTSPSSTSTPTASVIFTTSASNTPTCTPSTTTSSSLSRAPTSTFSPTPTTSPSSTSTPTASVIFTTSASSTPTCTSSTTTSSSLSRAPTSTFSPTPTTSPSSTSTSTFPPTPSSTTSSTSSTTPSRSPTPGATLTFTSTSSSTLSPTSLLSRSLTLSTTLTPILTPFSTLSSTTSQTFSHLCTPTSTTSHTATLSPSETATALPTGTVTPTLTTPLTLCQDGPAVSENGHMSLQSGHRRCVQPASIGQGSALGRRPKLVIKILKLAGNLTVALPSGNRHYFSRDVGRQDVVPLDSAPASVLLLYDPPAGTAARRSKAEAGIFEVDIFVVQAPSGVFICVLAFGILIGLPCCMYCSRRHARHVSTQSPSEAHWCRHPTAVHVKLLSWFLSRTEVCLISGLYLLIGGLIWYVVLSCMADTEDPEFSGAALGFAAAGLGGALCAAACLWGLRDSSAHACPVCDRDTSLWYFSGTYLPPPPASTAGVGKGHTDCMRCIQCSKVVVMDRWPQGPVTRPYHWTCWEQVCAEVCTAPAMLRAWCEDHNPEDVELAYLLVACAQCGSQAGVDFLLELRPHLDLYPIPEMLNARHCVASAGNVEGLRTLLERSTGCFDVLYDNQAAAVPCIRVTGTEHSDVYVHHFPLEYNCKPVYTGHFHGNYIYYYVPQTQDRDKYTEGWCLSHYLGDGNTGFRLPIVDTAPAGSVACTTPNTEVDLPPSTSGLKQRLKSFWDFKSLKRRLSNRNLNSLQNPLSPRFDGIVTEYPASPVAVSPSAPTATETDAAAASSPLCSAEDLQLQYVKQAVPLLQSAVASGDEPTIKYCFEAYKTRYPHCLRWQYHVGHGLWQSYPNCIQQQITQALQRRLTELEVTHEHRTIVLDLANLEHRTGAFVQSMACRLQTMFQYRVGDGEWAVSSVLDDILDWDDAFVVAVAGPMTATARDTATLAVLVQERMVDPSLWRPDCKHPACRRWYEPKWEGSPTPDSLAEVLPVFFTEAFEIPEGLSRDVLETFARSCRVEGRPVAVRREPAGRSAGARARGLQVSGQNRFTDGLEAPSGSAPQNVFYTASYSSGVGTLAFCMALPANDVGLAFDPAALLEMCCDAVMKVHELRRQRVILSPLHIIPVYVYTYELISEDTDQIYGAMNRAMRTQDDAAIAFWRPLIWQVDRVLHLLPPFKGKLYRGINVRFSEKEYRDGQRVCWPAFSSASAEKNVAKEFVKGEEGTLFFIQSEGAKAISRFSKYPDEAEVLFRPNTVFEISCTLYGTTDIGQFYSGIDNISMVELTAATLPTGLVPEAVHGTRDLTNTWVPPAVVPQPSGGKRVVVDLPADWVYAFLTQLANHEDLRIDSLQTCEPQNEEPFTHVALVPDDLKPHAPLPHPQLLVPGPGLGDAADGGNWCKTTGLPSGSPVSCSSLYAPSDATVGSRLPGWLPSARTPGCGSPGTSHRPETGPASPLSPVVWQWDSVRKPASGLRSPGRAVNGRQPAGPLPRVSPSPDPSVRPGTPPNMPQSTSPANIPPNTPAALATRSPKRTAAGQRESPAAAASVQLDTLTCAAGQCEPVPPGVGRPADDGPEVADGAHRCVGGAPDAASADVQKHGGNEGPPLAQVFTWKQRGA